MADTHSPDTCDCCAGIDASTPRRIHNPPGLPAIAYRMGRHGDFLASIQARLSSSDHPALAAFDARETSDFTLALADALAASLDVLTFYAERTANEHYLRTATERLSVREMARLIGYRLAPGLAAGAHLAFTLQDLPGEPEQRVTIPVGARVQSVPSQDEQAQTFETVAAIEARAGWNAMQVQQTVPWHPRRGDTEMWLSGIDNHLAPGDAILIVGAEREANPNSKHWEVRILSTVEPDQTAGRTHITWHEPLGSRIPPMTPTSRGVQVFALRQRTALFGHNAPDPRLLSNKDSNIRDLITDKRWKNFQLDPYRFDLATDNPKIVVGSWIVLVSNDPVFGYADLPGYVGLYRAESVRHLTRSDFGLSSSIVRIQPSGENVTPGQFDLRKTLVLAQSEALTPAPTPLRHPVWGETLTLDQRVDDLQPGQALALCGPRQRIAVKPGANGLQFKQDGDASLDLVEGDELFLLAPAERLTRVEVLSLYPPRRYLTLTTYWNPAPVGRNLKFFMRVAGNATADNKPNSEASTDPESSDRFASHEVTVVTTKSSPVVVYRDTATVLTPNEFTDLLGSDDVRLRLRVADRDGNHGTLEAHGDQIALAASRDDDPLQSEIAFIAANNDAIEYDGDHTTLKLQAPLQHVYARPGLRINANVAPATHGETVEAILGSGDASQPDQQFTLGQAPLTYVSAATPSGRASTLELRVNDVLWREAPSLYAAPPDARVYATWQDDATNTVVQFGDGKEGARPPSGESNLRVKYRKGLGRAGNVAADRLTTLLARPLGVSEVTNPVAASGGEDPETLAQARDNAPLTVLTLDRAVSVQDYADFARAFAGIDKAHALWIANGPDQGVFLTVAGVAGAAVPATVRNNLQQALRDYGDPLVPLRIENHRDARFHCRLALKVDAAFVAETVTEEVRQALRSAFSFDQRRFGQGVSVDEVAAVAQAVPGVVAAHVLRLYRAGEAPVRQPRLFAALPVASPTASPQAAELLTLADAPIELEMLS